MKLKNSRLSIVMKVSILAGSIAAMASLIVGSLIVKGSSEIVYQNAIERLKYETNLRAINLVTDIHNLRSDAQYLVGTPPIQGIPRAMQNGGIDPLDNSRLETWQHRLSTIFTELIRAKPDYMQIRYIGVKNNGRELIRVDRSGTEILVTQENKLQEKGHTRYFKEAIKLRPGEVYLSDITLNREYGKISIPYTPMLRAASPVYFNNKVFGVLVINMNFNPTFNTLITNTPRELTPYITNEAGYFLAHPNNKMTFGFEYGNDNTIHKTYNNIDLRKDSDLRDKEFTITSNGDVVHVVKAFYDPEQRNRFFAIMLATSIENLQAGSKQLRFQSVLIMGLLVIISLIIAAVLAARLLRPLQLISKAADDLANGRDVTNLPIDSADEVGELARSFDNMNRQLKDKTRELIISQGQVHYANKLISLGEMAAGMAHEINSPIQTINLVAQRVQRQLKKGMSEKEINDSMEKISSSVAKISEIIDSLRKLSRGSNDDEFKYVKLKELIEDLVNMTEERFKLNNVHFEVSYTGVSENTLIQCQRLQISQVLINLVNNAYDAIQQLQEKWISVNFKKSDETIEISVTDSGPGINEEIKDKIFEPMFTTKEIGEGTGLGLSISNDIITKHHGVFYVDHDSQNTRFVIALPILH